MVDTRRVLFESSDARSEVVPYRCSPWVATILELSTTDYLVDRSGGLPQVVDDGTTTSLHDVTGNSVSIDSSDTPTYPLADALGSTRLTVDDNGSPIGTQEWDAWGNQRSSTGTNYGFGWTGQQYDTSSDLTYLRARYYSPGAARCSGAWSVAC